MSFKNLSSMQKCYSLAFVLISTIVFSLDGFSQAASTDPHSFARPDEIVVTHIDLDLKVDFTQKTLSGHARLTIDNRTGATKLYLDSRDLSIQKVTLDETGNETGFSLGEVKEFLGQPLVIDIFPETQTVTIQYETSPEAAALQWLEPSQTAGGQKPFLYSQSQAILARTWVPCQDSPGIRFTYNATVRAEPGFMAVMSASNSTEKNPDGVYEFEMPQPIPAYLLALAVGDLEFRAIGARSGVFAEPAMVEKAAWEFTDTPKMMAAAEKLYGPYRWQRYDILVLPPSFPFGGMENPRLTFATPTVLTGDRSLVALIAHELAHSWSGNLVTNATWNDFWLNEGFTTYIEHRLMEELYGERYENMLAVLSLQDLQKQLKEFGFQSRDTHLHLDLKGRDPDEAMNDIAYEKGHYFLRTMEETVGREKWDAFLRKYFDEHAFQSMTSKKFVDYLHKNLLVDNQELIDQLKIKAWIYGPGIPDNIIEVQSTEFQKVEMQLASWLAGEPAKQLATKDWTTHHWLHFLRNLPDTLNTNQMSQLDTTFGLTNSGNAEILSVWFEKAITSNYKSAYPDLERFLTSVGRRKFLKPIYKAMAETEAGLKRAKQIYKKARPLYHPISRKTIEEIIDWQES